MGSARAGETSTEWAIRMVKEEGARSYLRELRDAISYHIDNEPNEERRVGLQWTLGAVQVRLEELNDEETEDALNKQIWPELLDKDHISAVIKIQDERPDLTYVSAMPQGTIVTMDLRGDRVRVYYNPFTGLVSDIPRIG